MQVYFLLAMFELKSLFCLADINSSDFPTAFLFIKKVKSGTFRLVVLNVVRFYFSFKTIFQKLDYFIVVVCFFLPRESFKCPVERRTDFEVTSHTPARNKG